MPAKIVMIHPEA